MMQGSPVPPQGKEDFAQRLSDAIRDNPIPAALVGMGVLWMFMGGNRATISQVTDAASRGSGGGNLGWQLAETGKQTGEAVLAGSSAATAVSASATKLMSGSAEVVSDAADAVHRGGTRVVRTLQRDLSELFERQPLAVGALGLVMGAAIGTAFSTTQVEAETFGEASHALKKEAEDLISEGLDAARDVGSGLSGKTTTRTRIGKTTSDAARATEKIPDMAESALRGVQDQMRSTGGPVPKRK